ncbi:3-carboxy-cis,cis-muconate cycloisomerase [Allocatelliglobosispora scoriae]|uniref:3-carboxy-cis,cis-muconate cycloisomerase n=1 Tax=Allocatelliglobosispora scoriae TaxID=643052 RepID=A0A841BGK1_9ACTN|nr:3-carboxy-cis,cis-muconate cycloisomerase [Allocatelliglobosispora scoriae]MBB5867404.1 3-carboxy-cis,cis-muconate cycloisomerase [Allocatelliglobosispora scoriae]
MPSRDQVPDGADVGLLSPLSAGCPGAAATGDTALLQAMLDAEAALVRAQAGLGHAPAAAAAAITAAARADLFDLRELAVQAASGGNPVIPLVAALRAAVPADAASVHRGATSQDIVDTAMMLVAARVLPLITADLHETAAALAALASAHRTTAMPGRTLTQHAVPTTFGLKAAGWRSLVLDAADRLGALRLPAQLGGAAGTLAAFAPPALDLPAAYAAELGLAAPDLPWHTLRTPVADLAAALCLTVCALGKLAADVLVGSRTEIGELAEGTGGASSAMPHKANPVRATLIAAAARQAPALNAVVQGGVAAEDERPAGAWHAEWQPLRELLRLAASSAHAAGELTRRLRVFPDRMAANLHLTRGLIASERLAAHIEPVLGREPARRLLERAARQAVDDGTPLVHLLLSDPLLAERVDHAALRSAAGPATYIGAAAALVDRALIRTSATPATTAHHPVRDPA